MGLLGEIGTLEWARRSNGILGRGERARFVAAVLLEQRRAPRLLAAKVGIGGRDGGPDPSELTPPDSKLARDVVEECAAALSESVIEHSYRSYLYARALAILEGVECDPESAFAAAMFHDYGMKEHPADRCFTLPGAEGADRLLQEAGWDADRRDEVAEAITFHLNPAVPIERGAVQHLVHDGVLLDVVGVRASELDPEGIERVRERHPRLFFNRVGGGFLREHGRRVSGCRTRLLFASGFGLALRIGRWQD